MLANQEPQGCGQKAVRTVRGRRAQRPLAERAVGKLRHSAAMAVCTLLLPGMAGLLELQETSDTVESNLWPSTVLSTRPER